MVRKFERLLKKEFYNTLFEAIESYLIHNQSEITISKCSISDFKKLSLDDFDIRKIVSSQRLVSGVKSALQVVASVELEPLSHNEELDSGEVWLQVIVSYQLDGGIHDFEIIEVDNYDVSSIPKSNYTSHFVPLISTKDLDRVASEILSDYQKVMLTEIRPLDIESFIKTIGVNLLEHRLSLDSSILGMIAFSDTVVDIYDNKEQLKQIKISKGTIIVDPNIRDVRNQGSYNYTIVHEIVHWLLHKNYQEYRMLVEEAPSVPFVDNPDAVSDSWNETDWMEWHANSIAPCLLMPKEMTKKKVNELFIHYSSEYNADNRNEMFEKVIDDIAEYFQVSRLASKIRLQQLGFTEFEGIYNYVGNQYLRSYSFELQALSCNQTFTISFMNACYLNWKNENFRGIIETNRYVYVDSHFCLNDSKYVEMVSPGIYEMTDYAYNHMDECCLIFDIRYKSNHNQPISISTFTDYIMFRGKSNFEIEVDFSEFLIDTEGTPTYASDVFSEISKIMLTLPGHFSGTLTSHRKRKDCTQEDLMGYTGISVATIRRMETDISYLVKIEKLVAICIGLKLYPDFSFDLISKSNISLNCAIPHHAAYSMILRYCYHLSLDECNEKLQEMKMKQIG